MTGRTTRMPETSRLNPNAPVFVPLASRAVVEEFSDQWWRQLYLDSFHPFFPDGYRLRESLRLLQYKKQRKENESNHGGFKRNSKSNVTAAVTEKESSSHEDYYDRVLPDGDLLFHGYQPQEEEEEYWSARNAVAAALRADSWNSRRYAE